MLYKYFVFTGWIEFQVPFLQIQAKPGQENRLGNHAEWNILDFCINPSAAKVFVSFILKVLSDTNLQIDTYANLTLTDVASLHVYSHSTFMHAVFYSSKLYTALKSQKAVYCLFHVCLA